MNYLLWRIDDYIASVCERGHGASFSYPASQPLEFGLSPYPHEPEIRELYLQTAKHQTAELEK